jgi:RHS repeat-associated protein
MPNRSFSSSSYRYGFNGQEKDDEIAGAGSINTAEFWQYDTRLGRRWNQDPVSIAWNSSYACFNGNPIYYKDPRGLTAEGGGDKDKGKGKTPLVTGNNTDGYTFVDVDITSKGLWQKVGNFLSKAWDSFVKWDAGLESRQKRNDFTAPEKSKIIKGGQMPTGKDNPYNNNSIQASHVLSNPEVVKNDGIFGYYPGATFGGGESKGMLQKSNLSSVQGGLDAVAATIEVGLTVGESIKTIKEEIMGPDKPALTNGNESTVQKTTNNVAKQAMIPEAPVLIYYTLQTNDGVTLGTEQATQKDYKSKIKTMEADGYIIDRVDRQLKK